MIDRPKGSRDIGMDIIGNSLTVRTELITRWLQGSPASPAYICNLDSGYSFRPFHVQ